MSVLILISAITDVRIAVAQTPESAVAGRPNVLFISLDTVRRDHCSLYGYRRDTTPMLKRLAATGVTFDAAYAPSSQTAPSHATMFTGKYPITHGLVKNGLSMTEKSPVLAEHFRDAGYETGAVVSSFVMDSKFGFDRGFDEYRDEMSVERSAIANIVWNDEFEVGAFDRRADDTTSEAIDWLSSGWSGETPYFLFVHYFEPHSPYAPLPPYNGYFSDPTKNPQTLRGMIANYDESIAFTDAEIRRLLEHMRERQLLDNTVILVAADHGEGLMSHGIMYHEFHIYEEQLRIPMLIAWPGRIDADRRIAEPVELNDVYPTLLGLADIQIPENDSQSGVDLTPTLLRGEVLAAERNVFGHRRPYLAAKGESEEGGVERFSVVSEGWKLIVGSKGEQPELYNLRRDPLEFDNVVDSSTEQRSRLEELLSDWRETYTRSDATVEELSPEDIDALESLGYVQ